MKRRKRPATGADLIAAERRRQTRTEGWGAVHDDGHTDGELTLAAICYAKAGRFVANGVALDTTYHRYDTSLDEKPLYEPPAGWPSDWMWEHWKPSDDPIRNLVKAGALIAAEIDRIRRSQHSYAQKEEGAR